jgi:hypothetical protein
MFEEIHEQPEVLITFLEEEWGERGRCGTQPA